MLNKNYENHTILSLLDLTSLNDDDNNQAIEKLCNSASTNTYAVASVCIYPKFIAFAKHHFKEAKQNMKITTVINFPTGNSNESDVLKELEHALKEGADEIDMVMPYQQLINSVNNATAIENFIKTIKHNCKHNTLKIIIESGELKTEELIRLASKVAMNAGANFIKTSTGKVTVNATLKAAKYMLEEIQNTNKNCGFKGAGGIKTKTEALAYLNLASNIINEKFINPKTFRIGASSLLNDLLGNTINNSNY